MANTISASNRLYRTYRPVQLATVRKVDKQRTIGRDRLREQNPDESVMAPDQKYQNSNQQKPKSLK
jgi:hypothetical protein